MDLSTAKIASIFLSLFLTAITGKAASSPDENISPTPSGNSDTITTQQQLTEPSAEDSTLFLTGEMFDLDETSFAYDGDIHTPSITIKGDSSFTEGVDYTVSGTRNAKDADTYVIEIYGTEANPFSVSKSWTITKREVTVKPTDTSKHIGLNDPILSYSVDGLVEGDSLLGISVTREEGETVGSYPISIHEEGLNPNYRLNSVTGTFRIEDHYFVRGENAVIEDQVLSTCTREGSHDEVYYCLFEACKAECLRIHVTDSALGHDFSEEFTTDVYATCESAGTQSRHCTRCPQRIDNNLIPAKGHSWSEGIVITEPTCTKEGEMLYYCINYPCQEERIEPIEPTGHTFEDHFTVDFPASCTTEGQESRHCMICEGITDARAIPANGHSWDDGYVDKKPTCVSKGIRLFYCTVSSCKGTKEEEIEELGHDFIEIFITDSFPTCTKPGKKSWHCSRCREVDNITEIPARGHKWGEGDTIAFPTCETEGMILYTCTAYGCGATDTTYIPALGHAWDEGIVSQEPTCTQKGALFHLCTRGDCEATLTEGIEPLGHDFGQEFTVDLPATCVRSGKQSQHCSRCNETTNSTFIPALGHSWGKPSTVISATCTTSGIISYSCIHENCQQTRTQTTDKLGHDFSSKYTVDIAATCTKEGKKSKHCTRCSEKIESTSIPATGHHASDTIVTRDVAATCTEQGSITYAIICTECQKELWKSTVATPATGHNWDEGVFVIKPTTENMGKKMYTCKNCQKKEYELVDKIYKEIIMQENENGSIFSVKSDGYCPGSEEPISYTAIQGIPFNFRIEYSEKAKEQGFKDVDWAHVSADSRIYIQTPELCQPGEYSADIYFRSENMKVTQAYPVKFTVNLSQSYIVAIFEDVVSIDNRTNQFLSYQWYHNGEMIEGATKPYYQEMGGLTGNYYVKVNAGTDSEVRTCSRSVWDRIVKGTKSIIISENPIKEGATVTLLNFDDSRHTISVVNQLGSVVITEQFSDNKIDLDTSLLPAGNYVINVDGVSLKVIKK